MHSEWKLRLEAVLVALGVFSIFSFFLRAPGSGITGFVVGDARAAGGLSVGYVLIELGVLIGFIAVFVLLAKAHREESL